MMGLVRSKPRTLRPRHSRTSGVERGSALIPQDASTIGANVDGHTVRLTNLEKLFWPELGITKGDLLRYYVEVAPYLLPHLVDRAMVMKRYPHGAAGEFFFQKRAPIPRPDWIEICAIQHTAGMVDFPVVRDLASVLWMINLGCIDLYPWDVRCVDL